MTAGRGITHSERTPPELRSIRSKLFGIQSWVAEFTPVLGHAESVLIWTGEIGRKLWSSEIYRYADVMVTMKKVWRELILDQ